MSIQATTFMIGFIFLISGSIILLFVHKSKRDSLIPPGKIVFDDLHGESFSLYSTEYPLVGKPDLIIKKGWKFIPIEIKSGRHYQPKKHHLMQLIAYCQLTREHYHKSTPYGYLIYPDTKKRFKIPFTYDTKRQLEISLSQMSKIIKKKQVFPNHKRKSQCNHCNMNIFCDKKIQ
jgi:CRISPR-associated exonuclease Cas4